jgi:lipoprotein-anchoring transpeptidase ErfK/SrfK
MTSVLRQLSAIFLLAATTFAVTAMLAQRPDWAHAVLTATADAREFAGTTAVAANKNIIQPSVALAKEKGDQFVKWANAQMSPAPVQVAKKEAPKRPPVQIAKQERPKPLPPAAPVKPAPQIAEQAPDVSVPPVEKKAPVIVAMNKPAPEAKSVVTPSPDAARPSRPVLAEDKPQTLAANKPVLQLAPPPLADIRPSVSRAGPSPAELVRVASRLKSSLTQELLNNFELFLYVSKADDGSWAQRMYVFAKQPGGNLDMLYNWPVSTGREKWELDVHGKKQNSFTPQGYYELDPQRMHVKYHSGQWNQPMPYAMFFNWEQNGYQTGLAIHAASGGDINLLGQRASAGCVRLAPENARLLFNLIRGQYKGLAPKFAYDKRTATMDNNGLLLHDKNGKIVFGDGYKVLVFVENYGGDDMVAALF